MVFVSIICFILSYYKKFLTFRITESIMAYRCKEELLMGKMGRPKSDIIKDRIVTIRMSDEEHNMLKEYSKKHQQTITETIKEGVNLLYKTRN